MMPEHGDDRTELEPEGTAPAPGADVFAEEPTEFTPDPRQAAPATPSPTADQTPAPQNPAIGSDPDRTEATPVHVPARPCLPRTVHQQTEEGTEKQVTVPPSGNRPAMGRVVAGYRLLELLGAGTYGEVWLAEEERTGIRVAIKFLAHDTGLEWQLIQAEVKQLALLHADPGIVQLLDVELEADPPYYVMAYAERGSLARRLEQGPLLLPEALEIFRQLAEALAYVHAKGVRHCDLKPGNILLNARNRVLVADFGQAHLSDETAPTLGTFFYMAPEQADLARQIPDTRWDVYGLGAIFHAMLAGHPPREGPNARAELGGTADLGERLRRYRTLVEQAPRPNGHRRAHGMDRRLAEIIDRCLEIHPDRRLHDAGAVLQALARRERQRRQRPILIFGFVAQVLLFLVMGGSAAWAARNAVAQSEAALIEQLLESDRAAAALVANGVQEQLLARQKLLARCAADPALRAAVKAGDEKRLQALLERFKESDTLAVRTWAVADRRGRIRGLLLEGKPFTDFDPQERFAWRDWFSGTGDHPNARGGAFEPIANPHVSQPYIRKFTRAFAVGLSAPVRDPADQGKVIGVLYTPVALDDVQRWLDPVKIRGGFAVLVDRAGHCLRHREQNLIQPRPGANPPKWDSPTFRAALAAEGSTADHADPVDRHVYLASYAPLPRIGWGALVQHERATALAPVEELRAQLVRVGVYLLIGVPLLVSGLWGWLVWTLRRKDRVVQG